MTSARGYLQQASIRATRCRFLEGEGGESNSIRILPSGKTVFIASAVGVQNRWLTSRMPTADAMNNSVGISCKHVRVAIRSEKEGLSKMGITYLIPGHLKAFARSNLDRQHRCLDTDCRSGRGISTWKGAGNPGRS